MLAILAVAAAFRLPRLDRRPMHADEANQAVKAGRLYESGKYEYDTTDHHGPTLYWLTLPSLWISGAKDLAESREVEYRIVPAIFGLALILLLWLLVDGMGRAAVAAAALLTAISPAMVFYSRYYIQEMLLVFFSVAALGCGWRYFKTRRLGWILAAGAAVGMAHATKETWILSAAAAVAAAGLTWGWSRLRDPLLSTDTCAGNRAELVLHLLAAAAAACFVSAAFFSMFGKNWLGPWQSILAYGNYLRRGSEQGDHAEPWWYYFQLFFAYHPSKRMFWSEGFIALLAIVGGAFALFQKSGTGCQSADTSADRRSARHSPALLRFLTFYTIVLTLLYSLIPYKTPWCGLNFLMGMILLAGVGVAAVFRFLRSWPLKSMAAIAFAAGAAHLGWQAYQLNFNPRLTADSHNPYVYAHTPTTLPAFCARLDRFAASIPKGHDLWIQVVVPDNYWPLPWYLRRFNPDHIGYWRDAEARKRERQHFPPPAVLMLSTEIECNGLTGYAGMQALRPDTFITIYIRNDLWATFLKCQ
jgi:uncharacterized protein (TIGR03663 family)